MGGVALSDRAVVGEDVAGQAAAGAAFGALPQTPPGALPRDPGFFPSGEKEAVGEFVATPTGSEAMRDQMQELFRAALGLAEPWVVSKIEFSEDQRQLDLWLDFPSGSRFACPECQRGGCGVYDSS